MGVCQTVSLTADALSQSDLPKTLGQTLILSIMKNMPIYCDVQRLDLWEHHVQTCGDEHCFKPIEASTQFDTMEYLIDETFEFGRLNLYGAFRKQETKTKAKLLQNRLAFYGVEVEMDFNDLTDW